ETYSLKIATATVAWLLFAYDFEAQEKIIDRRGQVARKGVVVSTVSNPTQKQRTGQLSHSLAYLQHVKV
ncbi:MAG TPA: hypothetical protein VF209_02310, partial [Patescibacteria group bacterium]